MWKQFERIAKFLNEKMNHIIVITCFLMIFYSVIFIDPKDEYFYMIVYLTIFAALVFCYLCINTAYAIMKITRRRKGIEQ